jgi:hypothetical protein
MKIRASVVSGCLLFLIAHGTYAAGDSFYERPGQRVSVNGTRLNLYCMGTGSPAVVFDAGHQDWAPAWSLVQPRIAAWTQACSYDRPGCGPRRWRYPRGVRAAQVIYR